MNNLLLDVQDKLAILTINRPQKLNALNTETLCELNAILFDLDQRPDVNVIILTGSGDKAFVSGADINIPSFGGTQRLPRLIWKARVKEMIFTGDAINAAA